MPMRAGRRQSIEGGDTRRNRAPSHVTSPWRSRRSYSLVDHGVALAASALELRAVQDGDVASRIADHPVCLQFVRGPGDAFAAHAEHVGDHLLAHEDFGSLQPVQVHQQPAAQSLIH